MVSSTKGTFLVGIPNSVWKCAVVPSRQEHLAELRSLGQQAEAVLRDGARQLAPGLAAPAVRGRQPNRKVLVDPGARAEVKVTAGAKPHPGTIRLYASALRVST